MILIPCEKGLRAGQRSVLFLIQYIVSVVSLMFFFDSFFFSLFICLGSVFIDDFLASGRGEADQFPQLEFEQLPFSHPLFIMYSSGTTGAPKCMVHSAGVRKKYCQITS